MQRLATDLASERPELFIALQLNNNMRVALVQTA